MRGASEWDGRGIRQEREKEGEEETREKAKGRKGEVGKWKEGEGDAHIGGKR